LRSAPFACWLPAACWLLVAGCWLLAAGCWLAAGSCLLAAGCWLLAAGWLRAAALGAAMLAIAGWMHFHRADWHCRADDCPVPTFMKSSLHLAS